MHRCFCLTRFSRCNMSSKLPRGDGGFRVQKMRQEIARSVKLVNLHSSLLMIRTPCRAVIETRARKHPVYINVSDISLSLSCRMKRRDSRWARDKRDILNYSIFKAAFLQKASMRNLPKPSFFRKLSLRFFETAINQSATISVDFGLQNCIFVSER